MLTSNSKIMTEYLFVNPGTAKEFVCTICNKIFFNPVQIGCNDHIFCQACICSESNTSKTITCPICHLKCKQSSIRRVQFIDRQINALLVKCPNFGVIPRASPSGPNQSKKQRLEDEKVFCPWRSKLCDLQKHQQEECKFESVRCMHCNESKLRQNMVHHENMCMQFPLHCKFCHAQGIHRRDMDAHVSKHCPKAVIKCPSKCGLSMQRDQVKLHLEAACPLVVMQCNYQPIGCASTFNREDYFKHHQDPVHIDKHLFAACHMVVKLQKQIMQLQEQQVKDRNTFEMKLKTIRQRLDKQATSHYCVCDAVLSVMAAKDVYNHVRRSAVRCKSCATLVGGAANVYHCAACRKYTLCMKCVVLPKCICMHPLVKLRKQDVYEDRETVECDGCHGAIEGDELYHCGYVQGSDVHEHAIDLCAECATRKPCVCGCPLVITNTKDVYGNNKSVSCKECGVVMQTDEHLFHCRRKQCSAHPEGYDLCFHCATK